MYKFIPYKHRDFKGHFIAYAIGIEYQTITNLIHPSHIPDSPLVKLYINEEERISILPFPYYRPILLTTPIYISGDERIREETNTIFIGIGASYVPDQNKYEVKKLIRVLPRIVLYGYWVDKTRKEYERKGYFKTVVIPSPASLYEFNISEGFLEENIIKRYQFGYNAYIDSIFMYPKYYQRKVHNLFTGEVTIAQYSVVSNEVVRLDKLMRSGEVDLIYINQFDYDNPLSYTYDNYIKSIKVDKNFKAEDYLLIGVKLKAYFKQDIPLVETINQDTDIRGEFILFYNANEVYPFAINYELG